MTRNSLVVFPVLATVLLCSQAGAACVDNGIPAVAPAPERVELCVQNDCETALLSKLCGNVHYLASTYAAGADRWLFRVRAHRKGAEDDTYFVSLNDTELTELETREINCLPKSSKDSCDFINNVLAKTPP